MSIKLVVGKSNAWKFWAIFPFWPSNPPQTIMKTCSEHIWITNVGRYPCWISTISEKYFFDRSEVARTFFIALRSHSLPIYTEELKYYSKNRPKIKKFHWRQNRFRFQRIFIQKLWLNNEKWSTLVTLNDSKIGLVSFLCPEMIFDTFLGGVENILLTK